MTDKEAYTIVGKIATWSYGTTYCETYTERYGTIGYNTFGFTKEILNKVRCYLKFLPLSFKFVDKVLTGGCFYKKDEKDNLFHFTYSHLKIESDTGRIMICGTNLGEWVWLDQYGSKWWLEEDKANEL